MRRVWPFRNIGIGAMAVVLAVAVGTAAFAMRGDGASARTEQDLSGGALGMCAPGVVDCVDVIVDECVPGPATDCGIIDECVPGPATDCGIIDECVPGPATDCGVIDECVPGPATDCGIIEECVPGPATDCGVMEGEAEAEGLEAP